MINVHARLIIILPNNTPLDVCRRLSVTLFINSSCDASSSKSTTASTMISCVVESAIDSFLCRVNKVVLPSLVIITSLDCRLGLLVWCVLRARWDPTWKNFRVSHCTALCFEHRSFWLLSATSLNRLASILRSLNCQALAYLLFASRLHWNMDVVLLARAITLVC